MPRETQWIVGPAYRRVAADRYHVGYKPERILPVEAIILHYTGSNSPTGTAKYLASKDDNYVSAHFLVDRDGGCIQLVALDERAFHAGGATSSLFGRQNVNGRTIGIELMNVGPIVMRGQDFCTLDGKPCTHPMSCAGGLRRAGPGTYPYGLWEAYPHAQIEALVHLCAELFRIFPALAGDWAPQIYAHEDVDPMRKIDPGPAFPWAVFLDLLAVRLAGHSRNG